VSPVDVIVSRSRLFVATALLLSALGGYAWLTMARQEDPVIPARAALLVVPFPGASAASVERLVLAPLEDALVEVDAIKHLHATARANAAVVVIELRDEVTDVEPVYDEVERQLDVARREFPEMVGEALFDRRLFDQESIVIAVHGDPDSMALARAAARLKRQLLALREVSRVVETGDPGEQVTVVLDPAASRRYRLDPRLLAAQLASRNSATPGGAIAAGGWQVTLQPASEFESGEALAATPVTLPSGTSLPLSEVARVSFGPSEPASEWMRLDGAPAVALGVVPRPAVNLIDLGHAVDGVVASFNASETVVAEYIAFQPARVESRLRDLGRSMLWGVASVAAVLFIFMGPRLGFAVASVVPLVTFSSLALYAMGGGVLHQMSIAAMVLALGLLVDAAIVMSEDVQVRLDRGESRRDAARGAIASLAIPLGSATGTTVAAFVPMLLAPGPTGDFTRSLPIVILTTLAVSYAYAVTVTPAVSALVLKPVTARAGRPPGALVRLSGRLATERPVAVVVAAALLIGGAALFVPHIRLQFFPSTDRNELIVSVEFPEGTHVATTDAASRVMEAELQAQPTVQSVAAFVGRGVPYFYYNLVQKPQRPHLAQLLVTTARPEDVDEVVAHVRAVAPELLPGVTVVAQRIEQGPPVAAPIEFRVYGDDLAAIGRVANSLRETLAGVPGAVDVRTDHSLGVPALRYVVDDAVAARAGLTRSDVAVALLAQTRGLRVGELRSGDDPVPIVVRGPHGEATDATELAFADVSAPMVPPTALAQLATEVPEVVPGSIPHRDRQRVAHVFAQLAPGATFSDVLSVMQREVEALDLPPGVRVEVGGDAEASGDSNAALLRSLPGGLLLLLVFLMGEFNSFRAVAIVMATVPLAAVGIFPGLVLSNQPFGFMSMLGVFALVGIVVNNAIVLLDVIASQREGGATVRVALQRAVEARIRPILLTTGTTIAGMMPLALSGSTMWPPLAWSMISGLVASTLLTVLVIPALYRLTHRDGGVA